MNAGFFAIAFIAALNPKFLAVDLLLIENRRPRAMFLCILFGGMIVALAIGHARQLIAYTAVMLGAYMAISGLVQLT